MEDKEILWTISGLVLALGQLISSESIEHNSCTVFMLKFKISV